MLTFAGKDATADFRRAIRTLHESGRQGEIPLGYLAFARMLREQKRYAEAEQEVAKAWAIAAPCEMNLHRADCHVERAWLRLADAQRAQARAEFDEAQRLVMQTGYHRRDRDLEDLRVQLQ
jgi:hypothetical protein